MSRRDYLVSIRLDPQACALPGLGLEPSNVAISDAILQVGHAIRRIDKRPGRSGGFILGGIVYGGPRHEDIGTWEVER